jgi:segregation and condensation protein B
MQSFFQPGTILRDFRPGRERLPRDHRLPPVYRLLGEENTEDQGQGAFARSPGLALVEAALMIADEPLTVRRLTQAAGLKNAAEARALVGQLQDLYDREGSAFQVEEVAGGFQLLTRPEYYPWLVRLRKATPEMKLTPAQRETLAIVAYRQPITRADVESIRGVQCAEVLRQLMEKNLLRIAGREDSLGRPVLYGTTKKFLQLFGFRSLRDLPQVELFRKSSPPMKEKNPGTEKETEDEDA